MGKKAKFRRGAADAPYIIKRLAAAALMYGFVNCGVMPGAAAFSALAASAYFGFPLCGLISFAGFSVLRSPSVDTLLAAVLPAAAFMLLSGALTRIYGGLNRRAYAALLFVAGLTAYFGARGSASVIDSLSAYAFSLTFFLVLANAFKAPVLRGLRSSLASDEKVCLAVSAALFYTGVHPLNLLGLNAATALSAFALLCALYVFGPKVALSSALVLGAAKAFASGEALYLGVYALWVLFASVFREPSRALSAVSLMLCELLLAYYLRIYPSYSYLNILEMAAGCALYLIVPEHMLKNLAETVKTGRKELEGLIIRRNRNRVSSRLVKMSGIFAEMDALFSSMSKSYMDKDGAVELFLGDFTERVCRDCTGYDNCFGGRALKMREGIARLLGAGIEKGRITLIDIPDSLAKKCQRTNLALQAINQYCVSYRQYAAAMSNLAGTRAIIGKQLAGVSRVMLAMSESCGGEPAFNAPLEKLIKDELLGGRIDCREVAAYSEGGKPAVSVTVRESEAANPEIARIAGRAAGLPLMVSERSDCRRKGYAALNLRPAPKYDAVFGSAGCVKAGSAKSGDTHSLINLAEDRFMLALCDGMGSGEAAERASSGSISLIENFYRAGFDSGLILESVNGLMSSCCEETFCTIDLLVLDLKTARCDFIKLGAVPGFVLRGGGALTVEGNSLPLGILEETTPSTTVMELLPGDMAVLVTDGALDAFGDLEKFKKMLNSFGTANPQELADGILASALKKYGGRAKDDITVLTLRVFEKA